MKTLSLTVLAVLLPAGIWSLSAMQVGDAGQPADQANSVGHRRDGKHLFEREEFGGNGRTCITCHSSETGTVTPEQAKARFAQDPTDPLFRPKDSDDGSGSSYNRGHRDRGIQLGSIRRHARRRTQLGARHQRLWEW